MNNLPLNKTKLDMWSIRKVGVDIFCADCYTHERFFVGGQSWAPDMCFCGCEDSLVWYKMNIWQKIKATRKYKHTLKR